MQKSVSRLMDLTLVHIQCYSNKDKAAVPIDTTEIA